jgi:hypothetical protein
MKSSSLLSTEECFKWCKIKKINLEGESFFEDVKSFDLSFGIPKESMRQLALAKNLTTQIGFRNEVLVWIKDWGLASAEELHVINSLRNVLQTNPPKLIEYPGHLLIDSELESCQSLLAVWLFVLFAFDWKGFIACPASSLIISTSDEIVDLFLVDSETKKRTLALIKLLKLEQI